MDYYERWLPERLRDNEIDSIYRQLLYINRLDVPCDIKSHMRHMLKIKYEDRKMKRNMDKVIKEIRLYSFYSWGLFKGSDCITIVQEDYLKTVG